MLKNALLTTTVAVAIALGAPGALTPGAAGMKGQTVKVRPMVRPRIHIAPPRGPASG